MLQTLDPMRSQFLNDLQSLQNRMTATQAQLTSGFRISKPSDMIPRPWGMCCSFKPISAKPRR